MIQRLVNEAEQHILDAGMYTRPVSRTVMESCLLAIAKLMLADMTLRVSRVTIKDSEMTVYPPEWEKGGD